MLLHGAVCAKKLQLSLFYITHAAVICGCNDVTEGCGGLCPHFSRFYLPDRALGIVRDVARAPLRFLSTLYEPSSAEHPPMTNSSTPHTDLFLPRHSLPFCSHWHKQNTYTALSCLSKAAFLCRVSSQLSCHPHALINSGRSQFISFTAVCDGSMKTQTCLWSCFRFSGITRGGKQRLIKSIGSPWWAPLSICCCLLITVTQSGVSSLIQFKVYASKRRQITSPAVIMPEEDSFLVKVLWAI